MSPVIFGPNNTSTVLQNGFITANGSNISNDGFKNYITYGNFENSLTTGWSLSHTTLSSLVPNQASGSWTSAAGTLSISTVSSGQLSGNYSLSLASSTATTAGDMLVSQVYTLNTSDQAKVLNISFNYSAITNSSNNNFSGTSSNSWAVYIYDVTNSAWIQPAGVYGMTQGSGVGKLNATFQTPSNMTQFRLAVVAINPSAGATTLYFDNFSLGPNQIVQGTPVTDWQSYTPTFSAGWGTVTAISCYSRRVGDTLEIQGKFTCGTVAASAGTITMGYAGGNANVTFDNTKAQSGQACGTLVIGTSSTTLFSFNILTPAAGGTAVQIGAQTSITSAVNAANVTTVAGNNNTLEFFCQVPISGWSSNVQMSNDTDTRVVAFEIERQATATSLFTSGSIIKQTYDVAPVVDTHGAWDSTNNQYVVPIAGYYVIDGCVLMSSVAAETNAYASIYINGTVITQDLNYKFSTSNLNQIVRANSLVKLCKAGDTIDLRAFQSSGSTLNSLGNATANSNRLRINRLSGPSVVSASESVNASYWVSANFAASTTVPINFDSKEFDSHNAVTTSATAWKFTAPVSGVYKLDSLVYAGAVNLTYYIYKNGSLYKVFVYQPSGANATGSTSIKLNAGDYIDIRPGASATVTGGVLSGGNTALISIVKVGN